MIHSITFMFNSHFIASQVPKLDLLAGYLKNAADRMALVKTGNGSDTAVCPTTTSTTWPNCCGFPLCFTKNAVKLSFGDKKTFFNIMSLITVK